MIRQHKPDRSSLTAVCQRFAAVLGLLFCLGACETTPVGDSGFLEHPERLTKPDDLPFKKAWRNPERDLGDYSKIVIPPVTTAYFQRRPEEKDKRYAPRVAVAGELARYAHETFVRTFSQDPAGRIHVVDATSQGKDKDTLLCELAIVDFSANSPAGNLAAYMLAFAGQLIREIVIGLSGTVIRGSGLRGSITLECRMKDADTGELVFMFADMERGRPSIINIKDFQRLGHAKAQIRTWANQTLAVMKQKPSETIRDPFFFDFKPF